MVKRRRKTKFIRDMLYPVYSSSPTNPRDPGAIAKFLILRFDCNMKQLPGEFVWISY